MWLISRTNVPSGGDNGKGGSCVAGGEGGIGKLLCLLLHFIMNLKLFSKKKKIWIKKKNDSTEKKIELTMVKSKHK